MRKLIEKKAGWADTTLARIAKMIDRNDHNGSYIAGAELLGAKSLAKKFELIGQLSKLEGSMPSGLMGYRYSLYQQLMAYAKKKLSSEDYDQFRGSFNDG